MLCCSREFTKSHDQPGTEERQACELVRLIDQDCIASTFQARPPFGVARLFKEVRFAGHCIAPSQDPAGVTVAVRST